MGSFNMKLFGMLDQLVVEHPQFSRAASAVCKTIDNCDRFSDKSLLPVIGPSRSGKTRLFEYCKAQYPMGRSDGSGRPAGLYMMLPRHGSSRAVLMKMLYHLGYPLFYEGTDNVLQLRAMDMVEKLGIRWIMFDEMQHCVSQSGDVNFLVADVFKSFLDEAKVTLIGAGLEDTCAVLEGNEQLMGRCLKAVQTPRFRVNDESSRAAFRQVLLAFCSGLPGLRLPDFADDEAIFRWMVATGGLVGYIHMVFRKVLENAARDKRMRVTYDDLDEAHSEAIYYRGPEVRPFASDFNVDVATAVRIAESVGERRLSDPTPRAARTTGRSRRSRAAAAMKAF